jgi:hypothetical protein
MLSIWRVLVVVAVVAIAGSNTSLAQAPPLTGTSATCFDGCDGALSACSSDASCCGQLACLSSGQCGTDSDFGGGCRADSDCLSDLVCNDNVCGPSSCASGDDCPGDQVCNNFECEEPDQNCDSCDPSCNTYDPTDCGGDGGGDGDSSGDSECLYWCDGFCEY